MITQNRLNKKWYPLIWAGLIAASLIRFAYQLYLMFTVDLAGASAATITVNVFSELLFRAILPAVLCYLCASVLYSMTWRRGCRSCPRNDFIYITMIFTAGARLLCGIIDIFSILEPEIFTYSSLLNDLIILSTALYLMFFLVIKPRYLNDREAYVMFNTYSMIYLVLQGLHSLAPCLVYVLLSGNSEFSEQYRKTLESIMGTQLTLATGTKTACIITVCVFSALVIASLILLIPMSKKSKAYTPPEPAPPPRPPYGGNPFDEFGGGNGGSDNKVFEDFDL